MDKSFVTLAQHVCMVCGQKHDTGELLLDRQLRPKFDMHTVTGWGMCQEHQKMFDDGYVALVEIDRSKSGDMNPENVWRTGMIAHLKQGAFEELFDRTSKTADGSLLPVCWVDHGVIEKLQSLTGQAEADSG